MRDSAAAEEVRKRLPVLKTVADSYLLLARNLVPFFVTAAFPCVFLFLMALGLQVLTRDGVLVFTIAFGVIPLAAIYFYAATAIATIYFSVSWYRIILFRDEFPWWRTFSLWNRSHWLILLYTIVLLFVPAVILLQVAVIVFVVGYNTPNKFLVDAMLCGFFLLAIAFFTVWSRFSLLFPASAVNLRKYGFKKSWRDTRGNILRISLSVILAWIPAYFCISAVSPLNRFIFDFHSMSFPKSRESSLAVLVGDNVTLGVQVILFFAAAAVTANLFSIAFRELSGWTPPGETPAPESAA